MNTQQKETSSNPFEVINSKLDFLTLTVREIAENKKGVIQIPQQEDFLDLNGAAQVLHMPISSIHFHKKHNKLPFHKAGKRLLFSREKILSWVTNQSKQESKNAINEMVTARQRYAKK